MLYIYCILKRLCKELSNRDRLIQEVIFLHVHVYILYFSNTVVKSSSFTVSPPSLTHTKPQPFCF